MRLRVIFLRKNCPVTTIGKGSNFYENLRKRLREKLQKINVATIFVKKLQAIVLDKLLKQQLVCKCGQ
jgi:ribosomal protein S3